MTGSPGQDRREPRSRLIGSFTRSTGEWAVPGVWLGQAWLAKSIWSYILTINQTDWLPGMAHKTPWYEEVTTPALLRQALATAGYDDIPKNGLYLIGGMAFQSEEMPLGNLVRDLRVSKQAAGQLVDTLVTRGYLQRAVDERDRRKLTVTLTDRGHGAAAVQTEVRKKIDAELLARVRPADVDITRRTLAALVEIGRHREADDA